MSGEKPNPQNLQEIPSTDNVPGGQRMHSVADTSSF
eukprot:COSAG06_NODE_58472_length_277_cov_0.567416_1_plen_35_part_10